MYTQVMPLDKTLNEFLQIEAAAQQYADAYGLEVELEGQNIVPPPLRVHALWAQHNDNSLRKLGPEDQAIEYVCRQPYSLQGTQDAVHVLFAFLNSPKVKVHESYRTSIHVHVNFGKETLRTIYNMITLSLLFDELLVSQNGEHRIGNNFCLRAKDAIGQVIGLTKSIESGTNIFGILANERYSSINFASLCKFGSIEFRSLECTTHEGRLLHWINTLGQLKKSAKMFRNPIEIIQMFSKLTPAQFLDHILGPYALKYRYVVGMEDMLRNGMRIAQDVAYSSAWKEKESA